MLAVLFTAITLPLPAQEYDLLGSVELRLTNAHYKDSPVVQDPTVSGTWDTSGLLRLEATHRLIMDGGELVLDHAIEGVPANTGTGTSFQTGGAGTGNAAAAEIDLTHHLYQGYASIYPAPWFTLTAGRRRMNWGTAYTFSVTDGLHPQHPDAEVETGFDGISVALRPTPNVSLEVATAIQNVVATGDSADTRYGLYGTAYIAPVEIGITFVHQRAITLRPGVVGSVPIGPIMLVGEAAIEAYDPRGEQMDYQPLWSIGGEYTWSGAVTDISIMGEYLYNGLAEHYPETAFEDLSVTSDYAGGFARPGYRYLAGSVALNVLESWSTSHRFLTNLSDDSTWVSHSLSLLRIPAVDLGATVSWNSGDPETEFGDIEQDFVVEFNTTVHF